MTMLLRIVARSWARRRSTATPISTWSRALRGRPDQAADHQEPRPRGGGAGLGRLEWLAASVAGYAERALLLSQIAGGGDTAYSNGFLVGACGAEEAWLLSADGDHRHLVA
jgi:hypothetical protein